MTRALVTKEEGLATFQSLDKMASDCIQRSQDELNVGIIALNQIREGSWFVFGGFESWNDYLENFRENHGISRGKVYGRLRVARLAKSAQFTDDDLENYGIDTLLPYFDNGGPITAYNRRTGEIIEIDPVIMDKLPDGDDLGERFGHYVRDQVEAGEPASIVRHRLDADMQKLKITFNGIYKNMELEGVSWIMEQGDDYEDGFIELRPQGPVPEEVEAEFLKLLKVPTEWRE